MKYLNKNLFYPIKFYNIHVNGSGITHESSTVDGGGGGISSNNNKPSQLDGSSVILLMVVRLSLSLLPREMSNLLLRLS